MSDKKQYHKKYYEEHREKIKDQNKTALKNRKETDLYKQMELDTILEKLNLNDYKRKPLKLMEKYNVKFNTETKKYYV